jgi:hypothetical protein
VSPIFHKKPLRFGSFLLLKLSVLLLNVNDNGEYFGLLDHQRIGLEFQVATNIFFTCRAYRLAFGFNHPITQRAQGALSAIAKRPGQGNNPHRAEANVRCGPTPTSSCIYRYI